MLNVRMYASCNNCLCSINVPQDLISKHVRTHVWSTSGLDVKHFRTCFENALGLTFTPLFYGVPFVKKINKSAIYHISRDICIDHSDILPPHTHACTYVFVVRRLGKRRPLQVPYPPGHQRMSMTLSRKVSRTTHLVILFKFQPYYSRDSISQTFGDPQNQFLSSNVLILAIHVYIRYISYTRIY